MGISGTDLALTTARVGRARVGAFRLGFIPFAVKGPGAVEPGEYIWDEVKPPTTQWTLQGDEDCVCRSMTVLVGNVIGTVYEDGSPVEAGLPVTIVALSLATVTDANGQYGFVGLPIGPVTVHAERDAFSFDDEAGVVVAAQDVVIDLSWAAP